MALVDGGRARAGLERNSKEDRTTKRLLIAYRVDPRDGQNHPGPPGAGPPSASRRYTRRKLAAEPYATH
jgi:hypothetical protein